MDSDIQKRLSEKLTYISDTHGHWIFRCPYCGDSKNPKKGHLYVSKESPVFRCARCGTAGHYLKLLNDNELKFTDLVIPQAVRHVPARRTGLYKFNFLLDENAEGYLTSRLGSFIDPLECRLIPASDVPKIYTKAKGVSRNFPTNAAFFVCHRGKKLVGRCFGEDVDRFGRYVMVSLDEGKDCFVVNNKRDFSKFRRHKTVVVAEGVFDVLNTYYNRDDFPKDSVFVAGLNSNLSNAVKIGKEVAQCFKPNLVILADNDMPDSKYLNDIQGDFLSISIYRNKLGKDFGEHDVEPFKSFERIPHR